MKKLLISIIKIPIFILRSINAALMRLPISFIISVIAYAAIFLTDIFDIKWIGVDAIILHIAVAALISLVWGIIYTLSKPPLIKRIYNSEASKTRAELSRLVIGFLLAAYAYLSKNLPTLPRYYLLFFGGELVLNALLILIKARTKPQLAKAIGTYQGKASSVPASKEAKQDDAKQSLIDDFKNNTATAPSAQKTSTARRSSSDPFGEIQRLVDNYNELSDSLHDTIRHAFGEDSYIEKVGAKHSSFSMKFLAFPYKGRYVETDAVIITENGVFNINIFFKKGSCIIGNTPNGEVYAKYLVGDDSAFKKKKATCKNTKNAIADLIGKDCPIFNVLICSDKNISIQTDKNANILVTTPRSFVPAIQEINPDVLLSKERVSEIKNILNSAKLTHQQKKELKKYEEN